MAGIKGQKSGGYNKPTRNGEKKMTTVRLTDVDKKKAMQLFGSIAKAVEWAVDNPPILSEKQKG